ncbi:hypothetical protein C1645_834110 [Glomus cerebriforme]|uniref:Uncharacterized protein n=1 Tax=Glomus cerebriforme TaxID=658196 RepID=A0A397SA62_9GLOM|nr:hypothetical protein C1645_834110 [Glomus cerebriforme]
MAGLCTASRRQLVYPEDSISIFDHENIVPMTKRSNIDKLTWQNAISNKRSLIVVKRNEPGPCPSAKFLHATNDICHVIGMMYETLLRDYNETVPDQQYYSSLPRLHSAAFHDEDIMSRFTDTIEVYGMRIQHITLLIDYKYARNTQVHRAYWNITPYVPRLEQRQNALALLNTVNQTRAFSEAFQLCTSCVYGAQ